MKNETKDCITFFSTTEKNLTLSKKIYLYIFLPWKKYEPTSFYIATNWLFFNLLSNLWFSLPSTEPQFLNNDNTIKLAESG